MSKPPLFLLRSLIREELSKLGVKNRSINIKSSDPLASEIEDDMIDMITKSYSEIGGHHKIKSQGDLIKSYDTWVAADVDIDPEADVGVFGSAHDNHVKLGAVATDGGKQAKDFLFKIKKEILTNGWWGEVSGAVAHIAINKLGLKTIDDEKTVKRLLHDKQIEWLGEHPDGKFPGTSGWYRRTIGGVAHDKIIVGDV